MAGKTTILKEKEEVRPIAQMEDFASAHELLLKLEPETPLGEKLIALALRGLEEGVTSLSQEQITQYLGRDRRADLY